MNLVFPTVLAVALLAIGPMVLAVPVAEQPAGTATADERDRRRAAFRNRAARMLSVGLALVLATAFSWTSTPATLPGVAMASPLVFHIERGAFALALLGTAMLVGYRATRGDFPLKFGPWLEYADKKTTEEAREKTAIALEELETKVQAWTAAQTVAIEDLWGQIQASDAASATSAQAMWSTVSAEIDRLKETVDLLEQER